MKDVFKRICLAQIASDGGKGITELYSYAPSIWHRGYDVKDREILRAISLIRSGNGYGVKYSVVWDRAWSGVNCYIVYFTWRDTNGSKKQVSFHSFNSRLSEYCATVKHVTRWDHKSSRQTVVNLLNGGDAVWSTKLGLALSKCGVGTPNPEGGDKGWSERGSVNPSTENGKEVAT